MKWPFVSRARYAKATIRGINEGIKRVAAEEQADEWRQVAHKALAEAESWEAIYGQERDRHDKTLERMHALRVQGANPPEPVPPAIVMEEPDVPPDVVLAAMKQISPVPDKTYEANWQHWERNKEKAAAYPQEFADEIIEGAVFGGIE